MSRHSVTLLALLLVAAACSSSGSSSSGGTDPDAGETLLPCQVPDAAGICGLYYCECGDGSESAQTNGLQSRPGASCKQQQEGECTSHCRNRGGGGGSVGTVSCTALKDSGIDTGVDATRPGQEGAACTEGRPDCEFYQCRCLNGTSGGGRAPCVQSRCTGNKQACDAFCAPYGGWRGF